MPESQMSPVPPATAIPRSVHSGLSMKILLVDDDGELLDVTARALHRIGFTVLTARDGQEALQQWQANQPDVVVLEVNLPDLSGFEVCRQIREQGRTPVILVSASDSDEQVVQGCRAGADAYLLKPVSVQELAHQIRAVWGWAVEDLA